MFSKRFFTSSRLLALWAAVSSSSSASAFSKTATVGSSFHQSTHLSLYATVLRAPLQTSRTTTISHSPTVSFSKLNMSTDAAAAAASASSNSDELQVDVAYNLNEVRDKIQQVCASTKKDPSTVRLVAVSKTKPLELLQQAYHTGGQRVFGENYAQELVEKAQTFFSEKESLADQEHSNSITWHFIGALQSNKANMLVKGVVPYGTLVVETVGSSKVANKLNNAMETVLKEQNDDGDTTKHQKQLSVFVQVNTSGEDAKSGVTPDDEAIALCKHIASDEECPNLHLMGLMTIGAIGDISNFETLAKCRETVAEALGVSIDSLELSMGMSGDYEEAIQYGATNVRVGSTIFGARDYSNKK